MTFKSPSPDLKSIVLSLRAPGCLLDLSVDISQSQHLRDKNLPFYLTLKNKKGFMVDLTCYEKFLQPALETNPSVNSIIIPSLQMTELRHREVKQPVQATQLQNRFEP